jgi:threonyl-tRNA synthetase
MKVSMKDGTLKECKFEDELGKEAFWHTASHVLA